MISVENSRARSISFTKRRMRSLIGKSAWLPEARLR